MKQNKSKTVYRLAVAGALTLLLASCGGSGDSGAEVGTSADTAEDFGLGADVISAAQEEGSVVHAATILDQDVFDELGSEFEERYGIEVKFENMGASDTNERLRTEARSGQTPSYDSVALGAYFLEQLSQEGLLQKFRPLDFDENTHLDAESEDYFPLVANLYGIGVNTDLVAEEQAPDSWQDLTRLQEIDPEAPVLMHDPSVGSGGYIWLATMLDAPEFGEDYLRSVGSFDRLQFGDVIADNISKLVRGEAALYFPMTTIDIAAVEGTDVQFISPSEGPVITPIFAGMVEGAEHPNAAKLWLSFMWSTDGQELLARGAQAPIREGVTSPDPRWDLTDKPPVHTVSNDFYLQHLTALDEGLLAELGMR